MTIPRNAIPLFIALSGARDRAAHNNLTVGHVTARATVNLDLGAVFDEHPTEAQQKRIAELQSHTVAIIRHTLQTLANDISKIMSGEQVPASLVFAPNFEVFLMKNDAEPLKDIQADFIDAIKHDTEAAEALNGVTGSIVDDWQG